jgi:hypothetical protein
MADVSKLSGYAVTGGSDTNAIASKLNAYAVTGGSDKAALVAKLTAYAVIVLPTSATRPQVFVCT